MGGLAAVLTPAWFQDLDEAEEQYNMAFRSQIDHITFMTEVHNQRLHDLVRSLFLSTARGSKSIIALNLTVNGESIC